MQAKHKEFMINKQICKNRKDNQRNYVRTNTMFDNSLEITTGEKKGRLQSIAQDISYHNAESRAAEFHSWEVTGVTCQSSSVQGGQSLMKASTEN